MLSAVAMQETVYRINYLQSRHYSHCAGTVLIQCFKVSTAPLCSQVHAYVHENVCSFQKVRFSFNPAHLNLLLYAYA